VVVRPVEEEFRLANLLAAAALGLSDRIQELGPKVAGLDAAAATALVALIDFSPHGSLRQLSQILGLTHSGTVRLVDRLAAGGLVTREPGQDERSRAVTLTEHGRTAARAIRAGRHDAAAGLLDGLSDRQRDQLSRACEVLVANLTRQRLPQRAAGAPPAGGALCRLCDFTACGRSAGNCPAAGMAAVYRDAKGPSALRTVASAAVAPPTTDS
jgi:MarR family transcriptional regulator, negative regulator of the multidrug operon emrRAB